MVIKNKEERTESIWRFAAIAAIPLLLLFIAGFSLGDTSGEEKMVNKKMLEAVEAKLAETEAKLVLVDSFFQQGELILSEVDAKVEEFDKSLRAAALENNVDLLADWDMDMDNYFQKLIKKLNRLDTDFSEDDKPLTNAMKTGLAYFKEYVDLQKIRLMRQQEYAKSQMESGKLGELEQKEDDLKKQAEELAAQSKAQQTETSLSKLELKLEKCEEKLEKYATNKEAATLAIAEINDVQKNMLPQIEDKNWKNDSKFLNNLRTKIVNSLTIANTHLSSIK